EYLRVAYEARGRRAERRTAHIVLCLVGGIRRQHCSRAHDCSKATPAKSLKSGSLQLSTWRCEGIMARFHFSRSGAPAMLRIRQEALTFDDILLVPGYSEVLPKDVCLKTHLTRGIELSMPLVSAAMDTVTEARLAIAMAQEGGIGIIHKNMTIEQQANEVRKVKKFESGVVKDPITIDADATVAQLFELTHQNNISGV